MGTVQTAGSHRPVDNLGPTDSEPAFADAQRPAHPPHAYKDGWRLEFAKGDQRAQNLAGEDTARSARKRKSAREPDCERTEASGAVADRTISAQAPLQFVPRRVRQLHRKGDVAI